MSLSKVFIMHLILLSLFNVIFVWTEMNWTGGGDQVWHEGQGEHRGADDHHGGGEGGVHLQPASEGDVHQKLDGDGDNICPSNIDIKKKNHLSEEKVLVKEWSNKLLSPSANNIQLFA